MLFEDSQGLLGQPGKVHHLGAITKKSLEACLPFTLRERWALWCSKGTKCLLRQVLLGRWSEWVWMCLTKFFIGLFNVVQILTSNQCLFKIPSMFMARNKNVNWLYSLVEKDSILSFLANQSETRQSWVSESSCIRKRVVSAFLRMCYAALWCSTRSTWLISRVWRKRVSLYHLQLVAVVW